MGIGHRADEYAVYLNRNHPGDREVSSEVSNVGISCHRVGTRSEPTPRWMARWQVKWNILQLRYNRRSRRGLAVMVAVVRVVGTMIRQARAVAIA